MGTELLLTGLAGQALAQTVQITPVGQWPDFIRGYARAMAVSGQYAYVADGDAGLQVIDVSNPANPVRVGGCETPRYVLDVKVVGNYAYVADGEWGLQIRLNHYDAKGGGRLEGVKGERRRVKPAQVRPA